MGDDDLTIFLQFSWEMFSKLHINIGVQKLRLLFTFIYLLKELAFVYPSKNLLAK